MAGEKVTNSVIVALIRPVLCCCFFKVKNVHLWVNGSDSISLSLQWCEVASTFLVCERKFESTFPCRWKTKKGCLRFQVCVFGCLLAIFGGLRFTYKRVSRPLGINKRQKKNAHLLNHNLPAGEQIHSNTFWHEVNVVCRLPTPYARK